MSPRASAQAYPLPLLALDEPCGLEPICFGTFVGRSFGITGVALHSDTVHVWAWPASGPVFLGAAFPTQPDSIRLLPSGRFSLTVQNAPVGSYPVVIYAHDPVVGNFPTQLMIHLQVRECTIYTVSWPFVGPTGPVTVPLPFCAP